MADEGVEELLVPAKDVTLEARETLGWIKTLSSQSKYLSSQVK